MAKLDRLPLAVLAGVTAGWVATARADRRRVRADPMYAVLARPLDGRSQIVRARDGTPLHVEVFGAEDAPPVILLHGWTEALRIWVHQIRELSCDHRVIAVDQRGHGKSGPSPEEDYSIEAIADDVGSVLDACVREGERPVLVGHSLGAMAIVTWAGRHPEQVRERIGGAVLTNTGMGDLMLETLVLRAPPALAGLKRLACETLIALAAPLPRGLTPVTHRVLASLTFGPDPGAASVEFLTRMVLDCPPRVRALVGGALGRLDQHHAIASLEAPTIVVAGLCDRLTPKVHSVRLAEELPQLVEYVQLDGVGHSGPLEQPERISMQVRRLAASVRAASPA